MALIFKSLAIEIVITMYQEDIAYLKEDRISKVVSQGLAETYLAQPKYPVEYMAKWLLKYCEMEEARKKETAFEATLSAEKENYQITEYNKLIQSDNKFTQIQKTESFKADVLKSLRDVF